jgi:hypothetical protein
MPLVVSGTSFAPASSISIVFGETEVARATADANGSFSASFSAPASNGGETHFGITDGNSTYSLSFSMETSSPPVPVQVIESGSVNGDMMLDWSDVADPSGVTYSLEVASDAVFARQLLLREGLTSSVYNLTSAETGVEEKAYWRVKAKDGAGNESAWTGAVPITLKPASLSFPAWLLYGGAGAVVLLLAGFLVWGRKGGAKPHA